MSYARSKTPFTAETGKPLLTEAPVGCKGEGRSLFNPGEHCLWRAILKLLRPARHGEPAGRRCAADDGLRQAIQPPGGNASGGRRGRERLVRATQLYEAVKSFQLNKNFNTVCKMPSYIGTRRSATRRGALSVGKAKRNAEYPIQLASGEPHFVLRAEDPLAPEHVEAWAIEAELNGYPKARIAEARAIAKAMRAWRETEKPRHSQEKKPRATKRRS